MTDVEKNIDLVEHFSPLFVNNFSVDFGLPDVSLNDKLTMSIISAEVPDASHSVPPEYRFRVYDNYDLVDAINIWKKDQARRVVVISSFTLVGEILRKWILMDATPIHIKPLEFNCASSDQLSMSFALRYSSVRVIAPNGLEVNL